MRCLVEDIKRINQESKQHPKESKSLEFKWFLTLGALKQALIDDEASKSQQDSALHHKWVSFHMGGDSNIDIGLHQANN